MRLFMGGSAYATSLLVLGVLMAIGLLAHAAMGKLKIAAILLVPTVTAMVLMRDVIRTSALSQVFSASALKVEPQYGPLALFLAAFAIGIGVLAWMVRTGLLASKSAGGSK
jgi:hypothetical protein